MATSKFQFSEDLDTRSYYELWQAETKRMVPVNDLNEHPLNYSLVGKITREKRMSLKEDIEINGIREPLQVFWDKLQRKLILVSGHERLSIMKELIKEGKIKPNIELPCLKKDFKNEEEVRRHIFAINYNRKDVKATDEILEVIFPPKEYPLLYADLRGNYNYQSFGKSEKKIFLFTPEEKETARKIREEERIEQDRLREEAAKVLQKTVGTIEKASQKVVSKQRSETNKIRFASLDETPDASLKELHKKNKRINDSIRAYDSKLNAALDEKLSTLNEIKIQDRIEKVDNKKRKQILLEEAHFLKESINICKKRNDSLQKLLDKTLKDINNLKQ